MRSSILGALNDVECSDSTPSAAFVILDPNSEKDISSLRSEKNSTIQSIVTYDEYG